MIRLNFLMIICAGILVSNFANAKNLNCQAVDTTTGKTKNFSKRFADSVDNRYWSEYRNKWLIRPVSDGMSIFVNTKVMPPVKAENGAVLQRENLFISANYIQESCS